MSTDKEGFLSQFDKASEEVKSLKESMPHLFKEWQDLQIAKREFAWAQAVLLMAQKAWDER